MMTIMVGVSVASKKFLILVFALVTHKKVFEARHDHAEFFNTSTPVVVTGSTEV